MHGRLALALGGGLLLGCSDSDSGPSVDFTRLDAGASTNRASNCSGTWTHGSCDAARGTASAGSAHALLDHRAFVRRELVKIVNALVDGLVERGKRAKIAIFARVARALGG
jgi:hypothetical protein